MLMKNGFKDLRRTLLIGVHLIFERVPFVRMAYHRVRSKYMFLTRKRRTPEAIFTEIFYRNKFGGKESVSGPGSDLHQTRVIRSALPVVFDDSHAHTILDIPCGDFHWMMHVDLEGIDYTGADIVTGLIQQNKKYETSSIHFCELNLISDKLPKVDLVLCRDCLVHLSHRDAILALRNICRSGSNYLLTT